MRKFAPLLCLALLAFATSCTPGLYTGGGWLPSAADANRKATFGFTMHAIDDDDDNNPDRVKGEFQYVDQAADFILHVPDFQGGIATVRSPIPGFESISFFGTDGESLLQPVDGGTFVVIKVVDQGAPGPGNGDTLSLIWGRTEVVIDPPFAFISLIPVYENSGSLGGGNVKRH